MGDDKKEFYTGFAPLGKSLDSVVFTSKTEKEKTEKPSIQKERYEMIVDWMRPYANNSVMKEDGTMEVKTKPIFPPARKLRDELEITISEFLRVTNKYDMGVVAHVKNELPNQRIREFVDQTGLIKGVDYLIIKSLWPYIKFFHEYRESKYAELF